MKIHFAATVIVGVFFAVPSARAGDLLLAGHSADMVFRYDGVTATPFASDPSMNGPTAMVYDAGGNLLVLSEFSTNVLKFDGTTGAFLGTFIAPATLAGVAGITDPGDMEIGADGNLYVMSHFNAPGPNVARFDGVTGAYLGPFVTTVPVRHQHGLSFGPGGDLFQGNVDGRRVERFNGITGASMGIFAVEPTMFPIADLAFSSTSLYVTCDGTNGVARFDAGTGAFLGYLIAPGPGQSYWGILVDGGNLYLSNTVTGTIRKYDAATGAFISDTVIGGGAFDITPMVPEPATLAALAVGALAMIRRRRKR